MPTTKIPTLPVSAERHEGSFEVPLGDAAVLDNAAILSTKADNFQNNPQKLANVQLEQSAYTRMVDSILTQYPELVPLYEELKAIHGRLWYIEDRKREIEQGKSEQEVVHNLLQPENHVVLEEYLTLSRQVSLFNDQRASIKKQMNQISGSKIVEVKSHTTAQ
jgi:hypothetical protein